MSDDIDALFPGAAPTTPEPKDEFNPEDAKSIETPAEAPTGENLEKKKGGRPRKAVKLERVDTRLAPSDLERVRRLAAKSGHNESAMLRELILIGLNAKNAR